jgi:hypothetical protein
MTAEVVASKHRAAGLTLAVLVALGCAGPTYHKADLAEASRRLDDEACRRDAAVPRVGRPFVWSGGRLLSYPFMNVDPEVYDRCMTAKGYAATENE